MKEKLLLHTCCAPCSGFLSQQFLADFNLAIYFYNPNIYPEEEYQKRLQEAKDFFLEAGINFIAGDYEHQDWLKLVRGLEKEPEGGSRCRLCYQDRLSRTAQAAKVNHYDFFISALSISPHKDVQAVNNIGLDLARKLEIKFLAGDFKKNNGFQKAMAFSREHNFYRQNYCGCEFSRF